MGEACARDISVDLVGGNGILGQLVSINPAILDVETTRCMFQGGIVHLDTRAVRGQTERCDCHPSSAIRLYLDSFIVPGSSEFQTAASLQIHLNIVSQELDTVNHVIGIMSANLQGIPILPEAYARSDFASSRELCERQSC